MVGEEQKNSKAVLSQWKFSRDYKSLNKYIINKFIWIYKTAAKLRFVLCVSYNLNTPTMEVTEIFMYINVEFT